MNLALQTGVFAIGRPKLPFLEYQSLPKIHWSVNPE